MTTEAPHTEASADRAAELIAANRRRMRLRRWFGYGSIPLILVAALFVGKILSMYAFAHSSITSYVSGDAEGTIRAAYGQAPLNVFEPYKAPYNEGVGLASADRLTEARAKFEEALPLAWGVDACAVRVNLSLTIEALGDKAADENKPADAQELYAEALKVTAEMPEECSSDEADQASPDPERSMKDTKDKNEQRQQDKQQEQQQRQQQNPQPTPSATPTPSETPDPEQPSDDKQEKLKKLLEQGEKDRDERDRNGETGGGSGTDKPW